MEVMLTMDNPLSIVPSEGNATEFPVLKAFQEYIDAEQAKARKRMLGLSVFFIVLLSVVVVTFVLILTTVLNRNQSLSDRLLDYALKERDRTPVQAPMPVVQQAQPSADIIKTLVERLEKEQAQMKAAFEKQKREAEAKAAAVERERMEELKRIQLELATERAKAKKEADRKAEIERHRRRLYPDYYRMETEDDLPLPPPSSSYRTKKSTPLTVAESSKEQVSVKPPPTPASPPPQKKAASPLSALKPVTYFNLEDDDSVPFLIETPKQNK